MGKRTVLAAALLGAGGAATALFLKHAMHSAQPGDKSLSRINQRDKQEAQSSELVLHNTQLASIPMYVYSPPLQLTKLDVSGNALTSIPEGFVALAPSLEVLVLSRNRLADVPTCVGKLTGLKQLDLGYNQLSSLPVELCTLTKLQTLNLMNNRLEALPDNFGALCKLYLLGLKSNKLKSLPESFGQLHSLVELFITDNQLESLPASCSQLTSLVKLQASFNSFTAIPECLLALPKLELARFAVCNIQSLPHDFVLPFGAPLLPALAWCSLAGNPVCTAPQPRTDLPTIELSALELGRKLGDGASGEVVEALYEGQRVAVKFFRADVSPDGRTEDEVALALALSHNYLTRVLARVEKPPALVLEYATGTPMALKPTSQHLLRCKWDPAVRFSISRVVAVCTALADVLAYCHRHGVCHGDLYAHNVLVDDEARVTLCDLGASFSYSAPPPAEPQQPPSTTASSSGYTSVSTSSSGFWEAMEVKAYGLLIKDMLDRLEVEVGTPQASTADIDDNTQAHTGAQPSSTTSITSTAVAVPEQVQEVFAGAGGEQPSAPVTLKPSADGPDGIAAQLMYLVQRCVHALPADRPRFAELLDFFQGLPARL